jgi:hypothetical protein
MSKIQVTLDATKLRNLVSKRSYTNRSGEVVELQEVKFELVAVKEPKEIFKKDNMRIMKTHFASAIQTKEEREAKADTFYIGQGFTTIWESQKTEVHQAVLVNPEEEGDLPF